MLNNLGHYNQTVPDLHEVLALETHNQGLRNFVMPFVTHVSARKCMCYIQGVPYHWAHFVFVIFSGSRAHTEELFIAIG